ncbi:MAG TPA: SdiA-regulated domain-containing protein, partial [Pseudomonadales bacterium]|nr:SdiA-regulated domain-containing protein [Pseudomonadales bacterium]
EANEAQRVTVYKTLSAIPSAPQPALPWSLLLEQQFYGLFSQKTYDWEAISCDNDGDIWLASEQFIALLKVSQQGDSTWLDTDIYTKGRAAGLFQVNNGFIEGLAWQAPNRLLIAAERQERGIIVAEIKNQTQAEISQVQALPASALAEQTGRSADFSDLWLEADALYTLERNQFAVCRRTLTSYEVERCWSYGAIENSADYIYPENHYGIAEGLARIGKQLFIVVDSNQKKRLKTGQSDAMLFIYTLPEDW